MVGVEKPDVETVIIPSSITIAGKEYKVTSIGDEVFWCYRSLTSITIPSSVTSIGENAFRCCENLTSITIPSSVTSIGGWAFADCDNLTQIKVAPDNPVYDSRDNCNAVIETKSNTLIAGCASTIIPSSVTSIGKQAFAGCSSLTSITIPSSVTSIGESAFARCKSLTSITIPSGVKSIGESVFWCSDNLTSITIPTHITNIDKLSLPKETRIIRENV